MGAIIYPQNPQFDHPSERMVYEYFRSHLPNGTVCYFHYTALCNEFDVAVLLPNRGIVIVEIKGWTLREGLKVKDNNKILLGPDSNPVYVSSPLKQARGYRYNLMKRIGRELGLRIPIVEIICYPNMISDEYEVAELHVVSERMNTLLKGDFDNHLVLQHLENRLSPFLNSHLDPFDDKNMIEVRSLYEPREQIEASLAAMQAGASDTTAVAASRQYYSLVQYIPNIPESEVGDIAKQLLQAWTNGTRIYLISNSKEVLKLVFDLLQVEVKERFLDSRKDFRLDDFVGTDFKIFNFSCYLVSSSYPVPIVIADGKYEGQSEDLLKRADEQSDFNLAQFCIEHANPRKHIQIRAGAGTGKTFSMISRIHYLIYAERLNAEQLKQSIIMITFTREAAHNMKIRLQQSFQNYYLLTKDYQFFRMIEKLEDLKITTIHGLTKRLLEKYAVRFGLSNKLRIVTGAYRRSLFTHEVLNEELSDMFQRGKDEARDLRLTMFNLQKRLRDVFEKIIGKNIDLLRDRLHFGESQLPEFDRVMKSVLMKAERRAQDYFEQNNEIPLSDMMIKLKELAADGALKGFHWGRTDPNGHLYVFIDEFQDTDNEQIRLLLEFQRLLSFSFFVVGDLKQCIYRFRGAEDKAFDRLTAANSGWDKPIILSKNYRSDRALLHKLESIFEQWAKVNLLEYHSQDDRLISNICLNDGETEGQFFKAVSVSEDQQDFEDKFVSELQAQYEKLGKNGKLAILVRVNREVDRIRLLGEKAGIFVETDTGGRLFQLEPALDLYKLVIALQKYDNPVHVLNLYSSAYVSTPLPKSKLYRLRKDAAALTEWVSANPPLQNWEQYKKDLKLKPVLAVLHEIISEARPWDRYALMKQYLSDEEKVKFRRFYKQNLDQIMEKLIQNGEFDYLTMNRIETFLRLMIVTKQREEQREVMDLEPDESGRRVVCKTVHKSKGLEFQTVILPFASENLEKSQFTAPVDVMITDDGRVGYRVRLDEKIPGKKEHPKELENSHYIHERSNEYISRKGEEARLLYVALTRTIKTFVYFHRDQEPEGVFSWSTLIGSEDS